MEGGLQILERPPFRDLWVPNDEDGREGLSMAYPRGITGSTSVTLTSGTPHLVGGCYALAGDVAEAATFVPGASPEGQTHAWYFLAVPDESSAEEAAVVAVTKDLGATALVGNEPKTLSFKASDGGSGAFVAGEDTPLYVGILQTATTKIATMRGVSASGQINGAGKGFPAAASSAGGLTTPGSIASVVALSASALLPWAMISGQRA